MTLQAGADVEILVCSSASSQASQGSVHGGSGRRHARFRTLAQAYERFACQPVTRTDIACTPLPRTDIASTPLPALVATSPVPDRQPDTSVPPPLGSGRSVNFWSLSFDSVLDNVQSPRVGYVAREELKLDVAPRRQNYVSPDDYIPDSQPEPPQTGRRRLTLEDSIVADSDDDDDDDGVDDTRVLDSQDLDTRSCWDVLDDIEDDDGDVLKNAWAKSPDLSAMPVVPEPEPLEDSSQELPRRPLTRQPLSQRCANSQQSPSQRSSSPISYQDNVIPSSLPDTAEQPTMPVASPLRKRRRMQHHLTDDIEDADDQPDTSDVSCAAPAEPEPEPQPAHARHHRSLYILSPEPPVACSDLDAASLVTERLAKLAHDLDLEHRFTSVAVCEPTTRAALQPFDRGYWSLDTASWPTGLRQRAWDFLAKYVGRGDAGWGVWCSRRSPDDPLLRLYCFAATAGHTYLLLYLASQRQVLTTGATWMDSSRTPAIVIPPRKRKEDGSSRPSSRANGRPST